MLTDHPVECHSRQARDCQQREECQQCEEYPEAALKTHGAECYLISSTNYIEQLILQGAPDMVPIIGFYREGSFLSNCVTSVGYVVTSIKGIHIEQVGLSVMSIL